MKPLFTERELRAIAIFLPLALLAITGLLLVRPKTDPEAARKAERQQEKERRSPLRPRRFDPNTVTYEELRAMGLTSTQAAGLIRYRESGKEFGIPEDVATCYFIDDSLYAQLKPYIRIRTGKRRAGTSRALLPERVVVHPLSPQPFRIDTVSARYLRATGLLSEGRARVFINWRNSHPIENMDEVRKCYVIGDSLARVLEPYLLFPEKPHPGLLEINGADSATLLTINGIGAKTAGAIVRYREQLGGFVRVEQLAEVEGMTERNYEKILQQIYCDSCKIRKIRINFATSLVLARHPYMPQRALRRLNKLKELKGGWSTAEAFYEENILKPDEARRMAPYLSFELPAGATDEETDEERGEEEERTNPDPAAEETRL